ncbi:serine hydrolase [Gemmata sp.]|uniref:serine hydrolase n=1 Tax=Gemmata sp. TaxID=1914242 RepID=UPI003F6F67E7
MRRYALIALLLVPHPARAADLDPKALDEVIERAMKEMNVPGAAVVVVRGDDVVYLKGFGVRQKGRPERVTPDTVFPVASCSKGFTATLLAMLVADEKLKWDDKVRDHLDTFRLSDELADREVTLRDLLCHRTGMPRHDVLWAGLSTDPGEVIKRWGKAKASTSFRSTWEYSNVPFTTAGLIAGRIERGDWAAAVQKRIFDPLQMTASSCTSRAGSSAADHATPHYLAFDKSVSQVKWDEIDHAGGAGCVNSTAADLANWLRFQIAGGKFDGKRLLPERVLKETHAPQMLFKPEGAFALYFPKRATRFSSYGLGWFVHDYRGFDCVSHGGTLTGFRAQCMLVPEKRVGVFVVCNLRPSLFAEAVAKTALDQLLGLPPEDWVKEGKASLELLDFTTAVRLNKRKTDRKPDTKPSLPLKSYAGSYDEPAYGRAAVALDGEQLRVKWGKLAFRLEHYHFDTFTAVPVEPADEVATLDRTTFDVVFRLSAAGDVEGMTFLEQDFARAKK